jgi:lysophospholipase L1-like esterase
MYDWPPLGEENYLLIGDSLIKHVNKTKHMRVMAYPGATASTLIRKISEWEIVPDLYTIVIVAVGTNNTANLTEPPREILLDITNLLDTVKDTNPGAMIAYSGMLTRPKDIGTIVEQRRKLLNKQLERACRSRGIYFIKSWKSLMNGLLIRDRVYARDGLHLNRFGTRFLYRFYEGTIKNIEGIMKL